MRSATERDDSRMRRREKSSRRLRRMRRAGNWPDARYNFTLTPAPFAACAAGDQRRLAAAFFLPPFLPPPRWAAFIFAIGRVEAAEFFFGAYFVTDFFAARFLPAAFLAAGLFFAAAFFAGAVLAADFFATGLFFTAAFFAAPFLAVTFFGAFFGAFLAAIFLPAFLAAAFFTVGFFFVAAFFFAVTSASDAVGAAATCLATGALTGWAFAPDAGAGLAGFFARLAAAITFLCRSSSDGATSSSADSSATAAACGCAGNLRNTFSISPKMTLMSPSPFTIFNLSCVR